MLYAALESYVYLPSTLKESSKDTYRRHTIEDMRDAFKGIDNPQKVKRCLFADGSKVRNKTRSMRWDGYPPAVEKYTTLPGTPGGF